MQNKNIVPIIIVILIIVGLGVYFLNRRAPAPTEKTTTTNSTYNTQAQGKVIFGVTDAASDMGDVSAVFVTVNKVEVHSATNGWATVSTQTKDYNLLALKASGAVSLLASANLDAGTYDQIKLSISKVIVVKSGVQSEAKLPSGELKIVGNTIVKANTTSSVVFDFAADKSLHLTGNGQFIFAPVIKITRESDVDVKIKLNNEIDITGGTKEKDEDVGMDEKGEVKSNFELKGTLNIESDDSIKLNSGTGIKLND